MLLFTEDRSDGTRRHYTATLGLDDVFRDPDGKAVARRLPNDNIAIDPASISIALARKDQPNPCPAPARDKYGRGEDKGDKDRAYEDFVKKFVNDPPTESGYGVQLPNPSQNDKLVFYDDCQRTTGMMVEAKGTGYAAILAKNVYQLDTSLSAQWLDQSKRQLQASGARPLRWYFAEPEAAAFAKKIFLDASDNQQRIQIEVLPWLEGMK